MIKFLDLKKQYESIKNEINFGIMDVIEDTAFINGRYVTRFEDDFANYQSSEFCIGVANGTDAIEIAIEALKLPEKSEIIVPANSFIASSEAVTRSGHMVRFCDCDPDNYTISIEDLKNKINERTAAIVAVHLYGHPCEMDEINSLAGKHGLKVIEDCAQAHGAEYKGRRIGALGDIGTFSFYPGKNLGAYGDAGAIVTNDKILAERCRMIANHGRIDKYNHEFEGRNSRMDGIQGAILDIKLKHLDAWIERRREIAGMYLAGIKNSKLILPVIENWANHAFHLFVLRTEKRDELIEYLRLSEIETGIHYPIALPKLKAYDYLNQVDMKCAANNYDSKILSIPIGEHLSDEEINFVIDQLNQF